MNDAGLRRMLTAIAVTLLVCGLYVAYRQTLRSHWQSKLDEFRQQGIPVASAELDAWYATPPAGNNAADLYLEAQHRFKRPLVNQQTLLPIAGTTNFPPRTTPIPNDIRRVTEQY